MARPLPLMTASWANCKAAVDAGAYVVPVRASVGVPKPGQWCHRTLLAWFLEQRTGQHVPELAAPEPAQMSLTLVEEMR